MFFSRGPLRHPAGWVRAGLALTSGRGRAGTGLALKPPFSCCRTLDLEFKLGLLVAKRVFFTRET